MILAGLWAAGIIFGDEEGALEATIDPSPVVVNAGSDVELTVNPTWDGDALTSGVTYKWSATPTTLGSFDLTRQRTVTYTAGNSAGTGTVSCEVTYVDSDDKTYTKVVTASLTVNPAVLDTVVLVPSVRTLEPGMSQEFLASAYNSVGEELPNATIAWTVWNLTSSQYTLNATTGHSVMFTAVDFGGGRLNASATDSTGSAVGTAVINIVPDLPARNSTIKWYDMFAIPNEGFWDLRWDVTKLDEPLTDTYPYLYRWYGSQEGNSWIYTSMRMNVTGRNMYEVNMNGNPTFLPMLGNYRGGTADIRWYGNYMNMDETTRYPDFIGSQIDGWIWIMNGTVTLDKDAARTVLGIGASDFDSDFNGWWAANAEGFKLDYTNWLNYEGKVRIDIYNSYEYPFTLMYLDMTAAKVGDKVVLTYDTVSWGIDVLIAMQMWDAGVLDTYWYYEDFWFNATIGPEKMDLNLDTGVEYAVYAYETTLESEPCWEWEALVQDVLPKSAEHPRSNYTPYANLEYEMKSPGSDLYGQWLTYDYAPSAWNLTENETLIVEWPQGDVMFVKHGGTFFNTTQLYGQMEMRHSEPMDTAGLDMPPGKFAINNVTNQVIFQGPFNMWQWSKDQTHNQNLKDEWDRLGVLPYGIPTIELALKIDVPKYPDYMTIEGIPSLVDTNTATDFTVKVWDQFSNPYPFYNGTVRFFTNDSAAVLPGDYTFSNAGEASFSVVFNTPGYMNLTVVDIANASIDGNVDLQVGPEATSMVFLAVPYNAQTYMPFSLRVTVYDQFGNVFSNYTGQVNFTTTDTGGSVMLPADYTFTAGDAGTHLFAHGFVLETIGWQDIVVVDLADSLLTATLTIEVISAYPASKDFTVYDMFEEPWGWWWPIRWDFYITDIVITDEPHMNTMLFMPGKTDQYQCMMYAPYRFAVDALNQSLMSVDTPVMMPMFGSVVDGASVDMGIYFQYLEPTWWWDYWVPNWVSIPGGIDEEWLNRSGADGYDLGTVYTVEMNREAAEQWMGMPQTDDVATWWASNNATYTGDWEAWVDDQGNNVYDIFCGYEWAYDINGGTWMNLVEDGATGNVTLTIAHIALGFEILMTRWMSAAELSPLEPYYEDFTLHAQYSKYVTNVSTDGVAQYSLHAVKANKTATDGGAWVWEPAKIDYITKIGHPSDYRPYSTKMYQSWNAGDTFLGQQISYEQTPTWFNLTDGDSLTIQLPTGTVPGYKGVALTSTDIDNAAVGDKSGIYAIMQNGTMDLGYFVTDWPLGSGLDLTPLYNAGTKTLTIAGPQDFNNFWHTPTGILYHGAPWIEFNVTPLKAAAASVPEVSSGGVVSSSASSEMMSLAVVAAATILAVAALGACARRKY
ncbi:MAG: hypothetical protein A3K76_00435 [Euryarchaeota archaeon RBG_13_57_23]|nr:MAG: hypothetical protein A3K76_00435 [Euryarchaeota archaeon RBG_13_57_23]